MLLIIAIVVFALSLFSIKKNYSRLFKGFSGDKPSVENPIHKSLPDGSSQNGSASERENKTKGDTIEKKEDEVSEPSKDSGKPGEKKGNSNIDLKQM